MKICLALEENFHREKNAQKRFFLAFLLSVEALLEAEPNEFRFGTFYVFFSLSFFSLCKLYTF